MANALHIQCKTWVFSACGEVQLTNGGTDGKQGTQRKEQWRVRLQLPLRKLAPEALLGVLATPWWFRSKPVALPHVAAPNKRPAFRRPYTH